MKYHLLKTKLLSTNMEKYHVCHSLDILPINPNTYSGYDN